MVCHLHSQHTTACGLLQKACSLAPALRCVIPPTCSWVHCDLGLAGRQAEINRKRELTMQADVKRLEISLAQRILHHDRLAAFLKTRNGPHILWTPATTSAETKSLFEDRQLELTAWKVTLAVQVHCHHRCHALGMVVVTAVVVVVMHGVRVQCIGILVPRPIPPTLQLRVFAYRCDHSSLRHCSRRPGLTVKAPTVLVICSSRCWLVMRQARQCATTNNWALTFIDEPTRSEHPGAHCVLLYTGVSRSSRLQSCKRPSIAWPSAYS